MQSVTSTMLLILFCNWLHITARFILGYVVRRLVIIIIIIKITYQNEALQMPHSLEQKAQ